MNSMLIPLIGYLILTVFIAVWAQRKSNTQESGHNFLEEYFIGGRSLGGFVLAMTIVASYTSASSFIGGPGVAYKLGLGWVLLAMIQVPTTFLTLGILGKRFAIIGRRLNAVTVTDFLYARYKSDAVVILCSAAVLIFFAASILAQFIGGGRIFQAVTGYPYEVGLTIFGACVILYTTIGGFRAVVLTDALQGIIMLIASVVLLGAVIYCGGGTTQCIQTLKTIDPGLITPTGAHGAIHTPFLFSFWILVGLGILGLPQTVQRCFSYKDSRAMHSAMIVGTLIIGFLLLCMHLAGTFGRVILPDLSSGDLVIPSLIVEILPPFWAGVFVAGPLAAIMSTVDTMLLMLSASIVKDLYVRYRHHGDASRLAAKHIGRMSLGCTMATGILVFIAAFNPPDLLVWINLFAFGGLEAVFLWPIIMGLYWKRANACGAVASILTGVAAFIALTATKTSLLGTHAIVPSLIAAFLAFVFFSRFGKQTDDDVLKVFYHG